MIDPCVSGRVRFGLFELDVRSGELSNSARRQTLPEQPLALLKALLARPGELVTRDELRQQLWPADTFVDFEHGLNTAVKRVRDALGDSADTPRFIETLPRRGYRFIAPVSREDGPRDAVQHPSLPDRSAEPLDQPISRADRGASPTRLLQWPWQTLPSRRSRYASMAILAGTLVIVLVGTLIVFRPHTVDGAPPRVVPLTTLPGWEVAPSFSPDGQEVAFSGNPGLTPGRAGGENDTADNWDVYVKLVGSSDVRRLTVDPAQDYSPTWSPDGRQIAFLRSRGTWREGTIHLMSSLGGSDLKLSDFPAAPHEVTWSPDGRYIAAGRAPSPQGSGGSGGIYLIPVRGGDPRRLTTADAAAIHKSPAFSPDGHRLAYASCRVLCDLYVLELNPSLTPVGHPRRVTSVYGLSHLAWTRDGSSLVYDDMSEFAVVSYLWRARVDGTRAPDRIELAGLGSTTPQIAPSKDRLAFARFQYDVDIYRVEGDADPRPLSVSSFADFEPAYSPDGGRIAFCSSRAGEAVEVWISAAEGSGAHELTYGPGRWQCAPHWSPDGRKIAFDSQADDGNKHIWTVDAEGGTPRQVTGNSGNQYAPTWSADGQWIFFTGEEQSGRDIWRAPVAGGRSVRVTTGGSGAFGSESTDGKSLLYQAKEGDSPLLTAPIAGGAAQQLVSCVRQTAFSARSQGIYYVGCDPADPKVHLLNPVTGQDRVIGRLKNLDWAVPVMGLSVSPDGKAILYSRHVSDAADLMLIENFR